MLVWLLMVCSFDDYTYDVLYNSTMYD
jgi:hypothetical protein